jgi:hypothetical protein
MHAVWEFLMQFASESRVVLYARATESEGSIYMIIDLVDPLEYLVKLIAWGLLRGQLPPA